MHSGIQRSKTINNLPMWIIKISIVHFELQSHEDPIENDVQLLNHLTTVEPKKFDREN